MKKLLPLLALTLGALAATSSPEVAKADGSSAFFGGTSYDVSADYNAAPFAQGEDDRYAAYGYLELFHEMTLIADGTSGPAHEYAGADTTLTKDLTYIYDRHEFCADSTNTYLIWQAKYTGTVKFEGRFKNTYSYSEHSLDTRDGNKISVYRRVNKSANFETLDTITLKADFDLYINKDISYHVNQGECFFFEFDPLDNVAWDTTQFWFNTNFVKDDPSEVSHVTKDDVGLTKAIDWQKLYSDEQGGNNQFYLYGSPKAYDFMTMTTKEWIPELHWHGMEADQYVLKDYMNPGQYTGSMSCWVAESTGVISIAGLIKPIDAPSTGTDGCVATIYKNETPLFSYDFATYKKMVFLPDSLRNISVNAGDKIFYQVTSGKYFNSGWDRVSFRCEISWVTKGADVLTKQQIKDSFKVSSYLEIKGVTHVEIEIPNTFNVGSSSNNSGTIIMIVGIVVGALIIAAGVTVFLIVYKKGGKKHESK